MKNKISTLTKVNQNLKDENTRLSKLCRAEELKSLACMELVSLQQDVGSVTEASITQQKTEIELIQKLCDGTPWGNILEVPTSSKDSRGRCDISAVSANWTSSLVSEAIENIVQQYSCTVSKEMEHEASHAPNEFIESNLDTDNDEMGNLLDTVNKIKKTILVQSRSNLIMHENNTVLISSVKAKISKIQDIFYHRLHRDSHLRISSRGAKKG